MRTPEEMAKAILVATAETNRLLGRTMGVVGTLTDDAAVVAQTMLDLLAALRRAEDMLLVAMHNGLNFDKKTREEIIANHPGMKQIRAAIAKATGVTP